MEAMLTPIHDSVSEMKALDDLALERYHVHVVLYCHVPLHGYGHVFVMEMLGW